MTERGELKELTVPDKSVFFAKYQLKTERYMKVE